MKKSFYISMWFAFVAVALGLSAKAVAQPVVRQFAFGDGANVRNLSDNGKWAVAFGASADNSLYSDGARLLTVADGSELDLKEGLNADTVFSISACDVTDDGNIVVGELNGRPAVWRRNDGGWHYLALPKKYDMGNVESVTPDGKFAVGRMGQQISYLVEAAAMWNLETGEVVATPGLPEKDAAHLNQNQNRFTQISADGNLIAGTMSFSYLPVAGQAGGLFNYIYNVKDASYKVIGFTEHDTEDWTPHYEHLSFVNIAALSTNGQHVTGGAYITKEVEGSDFPQEYDAPYYFDPATGKFTIYDENEDQGLVSWIVSNTGALFAAGPNNNPYREWSVRSGKYWVSGSDILAQLYDYDIYEKLGISNSGTPMAVDDSGKTLVFFVENGLSYVLTLPEPAEDLAAKVNLLGSYKVTPAENAVISKLQKITLAFTRNIEVAAQASSVQIFDENGTSVHKAIGFQAGDDGTSVNIVFRSGALEAGKNYTLRVPAGAIRLAGDASRTNGEINVPYTGRENAPVKLVEVSPRENTSVAQIDATTNPVIFTFDAPVAVLDAAAKGKLYREDETEPIADLTVYYGGSKVLVYPPTTQYLYKDVNYRVELPAGIVTDVTGNSASANELVSVKYVGAYERKFDSDDKTLFSADFSTGNGLNLFLLCDNDEQEPSETAKNLGFADASNYPWWVVRDDNSNDMAAASHSMYSPAGRSSDWMVIPQIPIPDMLCTLQFKAQSFRAAAVDSLVVYAWENNNVFNTFSSVLCERVKAEGTKIFAERLTPGASEDVLEGDWVDYVVDLKDFSGKKIYLAFANENNAGSLVIVDDVQVLHNIPLLVSVDTDERVVQADEVEVKGRVAVDDPLAVYTDLYMELRNAASEVVSTFTKTGLSLKKGDVCPFTFERKLPVAIGKENNYTLYLRFTDTNGETAENTVQASVKNLAFSPVKRVVLEEFTGVNCPNCPLGYLAIEKISGLYGDRFIPMALHTYTGDPLGTGLSEYSSFLGFTGAPQAVIQRSELAAPMISEGGDYMFAPTKNDDRLWLQIVNEEMEKPADAELFLSAWLNEATGQIETEVHTLYALTAEKLNLSIFAVVLENNITGFQDNNLYGITDEDLGDFASGKQWGKARIFPFIHDHVVRQIYGTTFNGTAGLLPASIKAGETQKASLQLAVPSTVANTDNLDMVVMLIDNNTGSIVNAVQAPVGTLTNGIEKPEFADQPQAASAQAKGIYTLSGVRISATADKAQVKALPAGVYLVNGRKVVVK